MAKIPEIDLSAVKSALQQQVTAQAQAQVTAPTIANIVVPIAELLGDNFTPHALVDIIKEVFAGHNLTQDAEQAILNSLQRRLSNQVTRTSANMMGHAVTKAIDGIIDGQLGTATVQERTQIAQKLAQQAAAQLLEAAEHLLAYPPLQGAAVQAKEADDARGLAVARATRQGGQNRFTECLINIGRLLAGDVPRTIPSETTPAGGSHETN